MIQFFRFLLQPRDIRLQSPLYHLLQNNPEELHIPLTDPGAYGRFPLLRDLQAQGATDYLCTGIVLTRHDRKTPINPDDAPEGAPMPKPRWRPLRKWSAIWPP